MKTESIILSSGIQVNRTRKNGVTIITTGAIEKINYKKHFLTAFVIAGYFLAMSGSIAITWNLVQDVASNGLINVLFISPFLLFIGFLWTFSFKLFINAIIQQYEK
jgi:hypothetical protein